MLVDSLFLLLTVCREITNIKYYFAEVHNKCINSWENNLMSSVKVLHENFVKFFHFAG